MDTIDSPPPDLTLGPSTTSAASASGDVGPLAPPLQPGNKNLQKLNMKCETDRRRTYERWPVPFMDINRLSAAGFYYTNQGDVVHCAFCGIEVGQWEEGEFQRFCYSEVSWAEIWFSRKKYVICALRCDTVQFGRILLFCSEDGHSTHLRNIGEFLPDYAASQPRRQQTHLYGPAGDALWNDVTNIGQRTAWHTVHRISLAKHVLSSVITATAPKGSIFCYSS